MSAISTGTIYSGLNNQLEYIEREYQYRLREMEKNYQRMNTQQQAYGQTQPVYDNKKETERKEKAEKVKSIIAYYYHRK